MERESFGIEGVEAVEGLDVSSFGALPDELILDICEKLDIESLASLGIGYKRAYYICKQTLEKKREKERIEMFTEKYNNAIINQQRFYAHKYMPDGKKLIVSVVFSPNSLQVTITQAVTPYTNISSYPWILPGQIPLSSTNTRFVEIVNLQDFQNLLENLMQQGYQIGTG